MLSQETETVAQTQTIKRSGGKSKGDRKSRKSRHCEETELSVNEQLEKLSSHIDENKFIHFKQKLRRKVQPELAKTAREKERTRMKMRKLYASRQHSLSSVPFVTGAEALRGDPGNLERVPGIRKMENSVDKFDSVR